MAPSSMRRLVVVPLLVAGLAAGCGDESPEPSGDSGSTVLLGTDTTTVEGVEFDVVVPSGAFTFTVGEPVTDLPDDVDAPADDDTQYVGLAWEPAGPAPEFGPVLHGTDPEVATVTVDRGGSDLDVTLLGPPELDGTANGVAWVPVDGDAGRLAVDYDGLTQTFDLTTGERAPGPADGFYTDTPTLRGDCPAQGPGRAGDGLQFTVTCAVPAVASVPYVAGRGWVADAGTTFLVADVTLTPSTFHRPAGGAVASYRVTGTDTEVSLDRTAAVVLGEAAQTPQGGWSATVTAEVPRAETATLEITQSVALARDSGPGSAPATDELALTFTVELS
ncbi:hypothetical protein [Nocardioides sp. 1609]|uniref:hypothetical protein n=1 Tax=Nocardioides sp. 1609 TaxID=2508327 RepID=UPI00106FCAD4|nr:hypothetical protein [Nocardioides sp. 1609]